MILPSHRMFRNSVLEYLTLSNPWANTGIWLGIGLSCVARAFRNGMSPIAGTETIALAFVSWTLVEYVAHRFVMHHARDFWHIHHHESPREKNRNMVPLAISLPAGTVILTGLWLLIPLDYALVGFGSFAVAFATQDAVHYLIHNSSLSVLARLRVPHMHHHFGNKKANFGVLTLFWDWVFGTRESPASK